MKKYFFISFKAVNGKRVVGGGSILLVCSYGIRRMDEVLLDYYNNHASFVNMADKVVITSLTVLEKQTAAQLSDNFTNALIIDDCEKEEEKEVPFIERWVARDKDGTLCLYFGEQPEKCETIWDVYDDSFIKLDGSLFPEVKWSDE